MLLAAALFAGAFSTAAAMSTHSKDAAAMDAAIAKLSAAPKRDRRKFGTRGRQVRPNRNPRVREQSARELRRFVPREATRAALPAPLATDLEGNMQRNVFDAVNYAPRAPGGAPQGSTQTSRQPISVPSGVRNYHRGVDIVNKDPLRPEARRSVTRGLGLDDGASVQIRLPANSVSRAELPDPRSWRTPQVPVAFGARQPTPTGALNSDARRAHLAMDVSRLRTERGRTTDFGTRAPRSRYDVPEKHEMISASDGAPVSGAASLPQWGAQASHTKTAVADSGRFDVRTQSDRGGVDGFERPLPIPGAGDPSARNGKPPLRRASDTARGLEGAESNERGVRTAMRNVDSALVRADPNEVHELPDGFNSQMRMDVAGVTRVRPATVPENSELVSVIG